MTTTTIKIMKIVKTSEGFNVFPNGWTTKPLRCSQEIGEKLTKGDYLKVWLDGQKITSIERIPENKWRRTPKLP